jgi:hypothetical protein
VSVAAELRAVRRRSPWKIAVLGIAGLSCFAPRTVLAAGAASVDESTVLFREGRSLLNKGHFAEACEKFQASLDLQRAPGTLLNVANCLESRGEIVAALESVEEALNLAAREPDRRKSAAWMGAARDEIAALEPRVARLTVHSEVQPAPAVTLDGLPLVKFDQPLRLKPGRHNLEAAAPRRIPFAREFEAVAGEAQTLAIPELALETSAPRVAVAPAPEPPAPAPQRDAAPAPGQGSMESSHSAFPWVMTGVGGALFVGGAVTGLVAAHMASDLKRDCPDHVCKKDLSEPQRVARTALVADVLMGTGLVGLAVGVVAFAMDSGTPRQRVDVACGPQACGALVRGQF